MLKIITSGFHIRHHSKILLFFLMMMTLLFGSYGLALAGPNDTTVGEIAVIAYKDKLAARAAFSGDGNNNNSCAIEYKLSSSGTWNSAPAPTKYSGYYRVEITGLTENESYDVRVTFSETNPDVVEGNAVVTVEKTIANKLTHNSYNTGSTKWSSSWGVYGGKYGEFTCGTCHEPRTTNIKGVKTTITTPDGSNFEGRASSSVSVTFTRMSGSIGQSGLMGDDSDAPRTSSNRICEVCHSYSADSTTGVNKHSYAVTANADHENANDCTTTCHTHKTGFGGGGTCNSCHGAPPGSGTDDNLAAPYTTMHTNKHYNTGAGVPTSYTDASNLSTATYYAFGCGRCHSTSTGDHGTGESNGDVDVKLNAGTGGTFVQGGSKVQNTPPPGSKYFYNSNGTCSNVYCHGNFTGGSNATATWGNASSGQCGTCHGNASTPPSGGSHSTHVGTASGMQLSCETCHKNTSTGSALNDLTYHVNEQADWNLNTSEGRINDTVYGVTGAYSGNNAGTAGYDATFGTFGNCTNVYCHSIVQTTSGGALTGAGGQYATATWGTGSTGQCGTCHKADGSQGNLTTMDTAGHGAHLSSPYSYACSRCHNSKGDNTTYHANRYIDLSFNTPYSYGATGGYSQNLQHDPGNGNNGTCTNLYCHSIVQTTSGGALTGAVGEYKTTPAWNSSIADCTSCHGNPSSSGAHATHTSTPYSSNFGCSDCHYNYDPPTNASAHAKGSINVAINTTTWGSSATFNGGSPKTPGTGYTSSTCSTVYCHSSGTSVATGTIVSITSPDWGNSTNCGSCHGSDSSGRPAYSNNSPKKNSHTGASVPVHASLSCDKCHYQTTQTGNSIRADVSPSNHVNKAYNVNDTGTSPYTFTYTYNANGGSCSSSYCHASASPQWGVSTTTCSSCHSSMGAGTGAAAYVASHQKHTNSSTYVLACENCHDAGQRTHTGGLADSNAPQQAGEIKFENTQNTWATITYGGAATNFNYIRINYNPYTASAVTPGYTKGAAGGTDNTSPWTTGTCGTVWCHSNANPRLRTSGETSLNSYKSPAWNGSAGCSGCHKASGDNYNTMTTATDRLSTNHAEHMASDRYAGSNSNYTCNTCHKDTVSNSTTISTYSKHIDGVKDVSINTTYWGGGTWSAPNCSTNVYCHSTGDRLSPSGYTYRTISWESTGITNCTSCHLGQDSNTNMTTLSDRLSTAHAKHIATDTHGQNTNFKCDSCHKDTAGTTNTTLDATTGYTYHVNKTKDVAMETTFAGGTWSGSPNYNCSNTYCHSKGTGGTLESGEVRTVASNTSVAWTSTTTCYSCHGTESGTTGAPAYANLKKAPTAASGSWTNPTNVYDSDDSYAYWGTNGSQPDLCITGFGFTSTDIPNGSTITDITVVVEGYGASGTSTSREIQIGLTTSGCTLATGTTRKTAQVLGTSDSDNVYGGNNDLWGRSAGGWAVSDIQSNANFGVLIRDDDTVNGSGSELYIDKVRVIVHTDAAPKSNSHTAHMSSYTCSTCHNTVVSSSNSPITGYAQHVDKTYDVAGTAITSAYAFNYAGGTCGTSCHGGVGGNPRWGVTEIDCVVCHSLAQDGGDGAPTRRAVVSEFNNTWSH